MEKKLSLLEALEEVIKTYKTGGFKVKFVDADMKLECIKIV